MFHFDHHERQIRHQTNTRLQTIIKHHIWRLRATFFDHLPKDWIFNSGNSVFYFIFFFCDLTSSNSWMFVTPNRKSTPRILRCFLASQLEDPPFSSHFQYFVICEKSWNQVCIKVETFPFCLVLINSRQTKKEKHVKFLQIS